MKREVEIVYEDEAILAINKPSGLVVHSDGKRNEQTLTDWILERCPSMRGIGEPLILLSGIAVDRPGIVHRLDRDTSGIMILAKNQDAYLFLKKQFQNHEISKVYQAIVYGTLRDEEGVVDLPIARSAKNFRLKSAGLSMVGSGRNLKGTLREAITFWRVLKRFPDYTYIELYPKTGRMHQIRVHCKAINHPLVCDPLYAPSRVCPNPPGRLALHAYSIEFRHPAGAVIKLEAPLPDDFTAGLGVLGALPSEGFL